MTMNQVVSEDRIKLLAISRLDNQESLNFFACQDGSTLIEIFLKNVTFEKIPFRTIFYLQGCVISNPGDPLKQIIVDFSEENHRFLTFNESCLFVRPGLSVLDFLEINPILSDSKALPEKSDYNGLNFFIAKKHANFLRIIKKELQRKDFNLRIMPSYFKGAAYEKLFKDEMVSLHKDS